jgi:Tol biopolymer transport system component
MAFVRFDANGRDRSVIITDAAGRNERVLATRKDSEARLTHVYWSPDGQLIAARSTKSDAAGNYDILEGLPVAGGAPLRLTKERWALIRLVAWRPESTALILDGIDRPGSVEKFWLLSLPEGTAQPLSNDLSTYGSLSSTADGSKLVTTQTDRPADIWLVPDGDSHRARKLNAVSGRYENAFWTSDGRIVYDVDDGTGEQDIWIMAADGSQQQQLTFNTMRNYTPVGSLDGRYIFFASNRTGTWQIWRMNIDGADQKQLTTSGINTAPLCAPDGRWVFYQARAQDKTTIWKMGLAGETPTQVSDKDTKGSQLMALSVDGRLAYEYYDEPTKKFLTAIQPLVGGPLERVLELGDAYDELSWSPDGQALIYTKFEAEHGFTNLWVQPLAGGAAKRLTNFKRDYILRFDWPRAGKMPLMVRGRWTSDVVLISAR